MSADGYYDQISVIPAELSGPDDPQVAILAELTNTLQRESVVGWLATDTAALFAADVRPGPAGDEHDPRVRLSELVETVAAGQEISPEAATYYLQLLALAAPTDKAVLSWNGWTKAVLSAAAAELVEAGLVVTGKRARAGRTHFLPGGWLDMASPHLPIEQWKMAAYGIKMVNTKGVPEFTGTLSPVPPPVQFRTAWERCVAGDGPGFTELRTTRRRRR